MIFRPNEAANPKIILRYSNAPGTKMVKLKGKLRFLLSVCRVEQKTGK